MKKSILIIMAIGMLIGQVDYGSQIQTIIDANCTTSCHTNGGGYQNNLDLTRMIHHPLHQLDCSISNLYILVHHTELIPLLYILHYLL